MLRNEPCTLSRRGYLLVWDSHDPTSRSSQPVAILERPGAEGRAEIGEALVSIKAALALQALREARARCGVAIEALIALGGAGLVGARVVDAGHAAKGVAGAHESEVAHVLVTRLTLLGSLHADVLAQRAQSRDTLDAVVTGALRRDLRREDLRARWAEVVPR